MREANDINPLVSICMVTYNHSKWIEQAIEGVLMQRTNFPFELVITDDLSTDNTAEVIASFQVKTPSIIKIAYNASNLGLAKNFSQTLNRCRGKYVAICEGDDFWTDPNKLQKQIDFLEENPDCVISSHNFSSLYEPENRLDQQVKYGHDFHYDQVKYLEEWVTQPLTCVFRNIFQDYTSFNKEGIFCDVILFYELLKHGNGYFMKDQMATFRVHQSALSSGLSRWQWLRNHVIMFDYMLKYNKRDNLLRELSCKYCLSLYICKLSGQQKGENDFKPLREYFKRSPGFLSGLFTIIKLPLYILKYRIFFRAKSVSVND
jgi:glycosyltransferase involved in cell wall biosynthesis